ncbi:MAG: S8 family serine peptidase [Bacteroidales bacterium]|nr:S8 family serine peptidase [Bacteroidales bacterium]
MKKYILLLVLALALPLACSRDIEPATDGSKATASVREASSAFIPGSVIVQLDEELADRMASEAPDTKAAALVSELASLGVTKYERLFPDAGEWEPRHRRAGLHCWYRLSFAPEGRPATKAANDFSTVPGIISSRPERKIRSTSYFNDPFATRQWDLDSEGMMGTSVKIGSDINVVPVWDNFTAGSSDVIVGVLDTGIQIDHPDLAAVCIPGGENGSKCFIYGLEGYNIPPDDHGTHVSGVIAAVNNNELGISSIAGGRDGKGGVRILACPFMLEGQFKDIDGNPYAAMAWAADHGAVISQNSWAMVYNTEAEAKADNVGAMGPAIDYFIQYAGCDMDGNQRADSPMKGGVVIFAAGNESWSIGWPAAYENVIAVGATTSQCTRTSYSNYGPWVDICAPGGDGSGTTQIFSTVADSKYSFMMGTSMACPHVSGVAALIVSYYGGPGFTNEMLKDRLLRGANPRKVSQNQMIGPMVDALGSFTLDGKEAPEAVSDLSASASTNMVSMSWSVTPDPDDKKAFGYLALASKDSSALAKVDPRAIADSVFTCMNVEVKTRAVGDTLVTVMQDLEFDTQYYVAVVAYDYQRNYSALSQIRSVHTGRNNPPVIKTDYAGDYRVKPFEKLSVEYSVSDPDGHNFTVTVDPGSYAFTYKVSSGAVQAAITGNAAPAGKYTAHIVAKDSYQDSTDYVIEYEILENHAPVVIAEMPDMRFTSTGESKTFDLAKFIKDEDGEKLSYKVNVSDQSVAHLNASGNTLTLTLLGYGLTTATVTATDACKASCSFSFKVLIRDGSQPVDIYPNPVINNLNIRPDKDDNIKVTITNKAGAKVWSEAVDAGPFNPLQIDMSGMPGGMYYVKIVGAGVDDIYPIAKK